jgi:hypothetical protein
MPDSTSSAGINQNKRLKNTDLDKRVRGGKKSRSTKDDNLIPLDSTNLGRSQSVEEEKITEQETSTVNSDFESMRAKVVEDDQSEGDTQEEKSASSISPFEAVATGLNLNSSDESIFLEDPKASTSHKSSASGVRGENKKPYNSERVSNDPRINPRKAAQSPVLENASRIPVEPYLAYEKRVLPANHPSQLGRVNNDPRRASRS